MSKLTQKAMSLVVLCCILVMSTGCFTHRHVVGNYAGTGVKQEFREWYVLWGLIPLVEKDQEIQAYVANTNSYAITSEFNALDVIIGIFTGIVTINPRTISIER